MAQLKKKIEYVDEFRKFNAIEKLPPLSEYRFGDYFEEKPVDNNKFLRLKKEPVIDE